MKRFGHRPVQQHTSRQDETRGQRQQAQSGDQPAGTPAQRVATRARAGPTAVIEARGTARESLRQQQRGHETQQQRGQLRGGDTIAERKPGAVDAGGEGLHAEVAHRAVVGQRFHQCQRHAGHDGRARQRQRHAEERGPGALPQHARGFGQTGRPFEQRLPGQQVDIGIEHGDEHAGRAAGRADIRKPVVAAFPAEGVAQQGLNRADELQQVGVGVGHHVGGRGQRQHECPIQHAPARKLPHHAGPRGRHPDQRGTQTDPQAQPQGTGDVLRQHGRGQMRPGIGGAAVQQVDQHRNDRRRHEQRKQQCDQRQQ